MIEYSIKNFALRFAFYCVGFAIVFHYLGYYFLEALIPVFKWVIVHFDSNYHVTRFALLKQGHEMVFVLQVTLAQLLVVGGQFVVPHENGVANASTVANHVWQMTVMFLSILFAWPIGHIQQIVYRLIFGFPVLLLVLLLDTPLVLLSAIWAVILQALEPNRFSLLITWNDFLEAGGRLVLGIVGGALVLCLVGYIEKMTFKMVRK